MSLLTSLFNPFQLVTTRAAARNSYLMKLKNIYYIVRGHLAYYPPTSFLPAHNPENFGLTDYASFGIFYLINKASYYAGDKFAQTMLPASGVNTHFNNHRKPSKLWLVPLAIVSLPLVILNAVGYMIRGVMAIGVTIAAILPTAAVHLVTKVIDYAKQRSAIAHPKLANADYAPLITEQDLQPKIGPVASPKVSPKAERKAVESAATQHALPDRIPSFLNKSLFEAGPSSPTFARLPQDQDTSVATSKNKH
jgi:hypothetical protein